MPRTSQLVILIVLAATTASASPYRNTMSAGDYVFAGGSLRACGERRAVETHVRARQISREKLRSPVHAMIGIPRSTMSCAPLDARGADRDRESVTRCRSSGTAVRRGHRQRALQAAMEN